MGFTYVSDWQKERERKEHSTLKEWSSKRFVLTQGINLNKAHNPMAMKQAVANRLSCAVSFAYLDVCSGYWQLPVDDENSKLLTLNTPWGQHRFTRLPFNFISHRPRKSPKGDEQTLWGGPVEIMVEDFLIHVHGEDQTDDDCKLWRVLDRSREAELKFNPKKEKLWVSEISYDGLVFSADGLNQTLKSKHSVSDKVCLKY